MRTTDDGCGTVARSAGAGLAVRGDLDLEGAPAVRAAIQREVAAGCGVLVLDLSETTFLDAVGVGTLLGAQRRLRHGGGDLVLRRPSPAVDRVLMLLGVRDRFAPV